MSVPAQIALAFGSVAVLLGLMALVRVTALRWGLGGEVQRKLVHVGTGLYALSFPWIFPDRWPVYMLTGLALAVMVALRLPRLSGRLGQTLHGVGRRSYGDFLLALSVGLCFFLSEGVALFYVLPIAVLTISDAAAALAGIHYGTRRFKVEDGIKSIEGTVVFFVVTLLVALICLMFLSDLPPPNILALAVMIAAFGTLVEAQSWRGFDNLFLPLALLVFLVVHSQSGLGDLLGLAGLFFASIIGFRAVGPRFGLSDHAARVYVVAVFMILSVVEIQNAILPGLVLLAHAWCSLRSPGEDDYGELDVVAALAIFSFGWLAVGTATGWNAVQFYGLTAIGMVMGLCTLALGRRLLWVPAIALVLMAVRFGVTSVNPPDAVWAEPMWLLAVACLLIPSVAAGLAPRWLMQDRVLKLTVLSVLPPLGYYAALLMAGGAFQATERMAL
ncbi:diacylglycerol/polyprenol kinase family protein [Halodurantibacterium flavum]|uniref:Diacylglycerol/polyprenol kinase family protein n=1 Tax=Halodurantibacterium flavum TaxID=1382802 RepID=A0ABW4S125_9RHOB